MNGPQTGSRGLVGTMPCSPALSHRITEQLTAARVRVADLLEMQELLQKNPDIEKILTLLTRNQLVY